MPFPLRRLPLLVQCAVLKRMRSSDLVTISQSSNHMLQLLQHLKLPQMSITYDMKKSRITVISPFNRGFAPDLTHPGDLEDAEQWIQHNENVLVVFLPKNFERIEKILSIFFGIFKFLRANLKIDNVGNEIPDFIWNFPWKRCQFEGRHEVEPVIFQNLLDNPHFLDVQIQGPTSDNPDFHYNSQVKTEKLAIWNSNWLHFDSILSCKQVYLYRNTITSIEISNFLKNWIIGPSNLMIFEVNFLNIDELRKVFDGIQTFQWDQRPEKFRGFPLQNLLRSDRDQIMDIRNNDNGVATIFLSNQQFCLFSWKNEY